ncbi:MAG TPA: DUF3426 domain-containing protein [Alphaproteobacteria bacterium]|nr:DUF3426 domain-containing protein [Alphaproteobacteria bacterium]
MIISCPQCNTRYSVDGNAIGQSGRMVGCSRCGNQWHQVPVAAPLPPPIQPRPILPPQPRMAQPQIAEPEPAPPPPPPPPPPPEPAPPPPPPPPPEPEPKPEPEPEPKPEPEPEPEPEEVPVSEQESEQLSDEQLNEMLGDSDELEAPGSFVEEKEEEEDEPVNIDDLPEPEPLPDALISPEDEIGEYDEDEEEEEEESGGMVRMLIMVFVLIGIIGGFGAGLYFGRGMIVNYLPGAAAVYNMVGLGVAPLGEGLEIKNVKSTRNSENNLSLLVVRGTIINISDKPRKVPLIRVTLFDTNGDEVQNVIVTPKAKEIAPAKIMAFKAKVKDPSPLARRLEVTFTRPPEKKEK